jgi:16S rRNA (adenine1518-N6/adenine1519-N6)-dimethyltransferase
MKHVARKRFGQNFLVDSHYISRIIAAVNAKPGETVIEIGPGLAALTEPLIACAGHVHAIEIDRDLVGRLNERFGAESLTVHQGDALRFDFAQLGTDLRVVGNLPYNISSPLLFHLAEYADRVRDVTVMLQKEVVDRMAAEPGDEDYGRLSVMLQYRFSVDKLFEVPAGAFRPIPQVQSAIARLTPLGEDRLRARDDQLFARVVAAAFGQRRKTLRNTLASFVDASVLQDLGIDPTLRGERLSVANYVAIADAVNA